MNCGRAHKVTAPKVGVVWGSTQATRTISECVLFTSKSERAARRL